MTVVPGGAPEFGVVLRHNIPISAFPGSLAMPEDPRRRKTGGKATHRRGSRIFHHIPQGYLRSNSVSSRVADRIAGQSKTSASSDVHSELRLALPAE